MRSPADSSPRANGEGGDECEQAIEHGLFRERKLRLYKPISLMETKRPRHGGNTHAPKSERLLFGRALNPTNLPPGDVTIAAWAVDLHGEKLYPLAGVTSISAAQR